MKEIAINVFTVQSFFGIAFSSFLTLIITNWCYKINRGLVPLYTTMFFAVLFSILLFCLTELPLNMENIFTMSVYALLVYSCSAGLSVSLANTVRNTSESDREKVFGNR